MNTVTHIDCCECATCRADRLAADADARMAICQRAADEFLARRAACIVIPFPVRRTTGLGGIHESA